MSKKIIALAIILGFSLLLPYNLKAILPDTYNLVTDGKVNNLYSESFWEEVNKSTEYMTEADCKSKGGKIDRTDYRKWYGKWVVTCGVNYYSNCTKPVTGVGKNLNEAKSACYKNAVSSKVESVCTDANGRDRGYKINASNISYSKGINGSASIGNFQYGNWFYKNAVAPSNYSFSDNPKAIQYKCTYSTGTVSKTSIKTLSQAKYKTSTNADAYCVMPGQIFKSQIYKKLEEFDLTGCTKSNDNYHCGLAAIVLKSEQNYSGDYLTTLTALRLWTADQRQGAEGWWDSENDKLFTNSVYIDTANFINNNKSYIGSIWAPDDSVLFADNSSLAQFQNAIKVYREVKEGFAMSMPYIEVVESGDYSRVSNTYSVIVESNIDVVKEIEKLYSNELGEFTQVILKEEKENGYNFGGWGWPWNSNDEIVLRVYDTSGRLIDTVKKNRKGVYDFSTSRKIPRNIYTIDETSCPTNRENDGRNKKCYNITLRNMSINLDLANEITITGIVKFDSDDNLITGVGYYAAENNPKKYQYMVIFDKSKVDNVIPFEFKINPVTDLPICTFVEEENQWYDRFGNPVDSYEEMRETCNCQIIDGKYYVEYNPNLPNNNETTYEEYHEVCEQITCDKKNPNYNMPSECDEDDTNGTISDPEICRILNREEEHNLESDYKTDYGNEYCNIYCREELEFSFMPKETALAGQWFTHSVKGKYLAEDYLSMVVLSTRQCSSAIKYEKWKSEYDAANLEVLKTWNDLKYWEALYNYRAGGQGEYGDPKLSPGESCSAGTCGYCEGNAASEEYAYWEGSYKETLPDGRVIIRNVSKLEEGEHPECTEGSTTTDPVTGAEECSSGPSCSDGTNVTQAQKDSVRVGYNKSLEAYKGALDKREGLLYSILDCNFMNNERSTYTKRDYYLTSSYSNSLTGANTYTPNVDFKTYPRLVDEMPNPKAEISYEETTTYKDDYDIDFEIKTGKVESPAEFRSDLATYSAESNWEDYCGVGSKDNLDEEASCNNDLRDLSHESISEPSGTYWNCSGTGVKAFCYKDPSVVIPMNTLVNVVIEKEHGYYQSEKFVTQVYTGVVRNSPSSVGYWMDLDDYIYPVGIRRATRIDDDFYEMSVKYWDLNAQNRIVEFDFRPTDNTLYCGYHVINDLANFKCDDGVAYHECYCDPTIEECDSGSSGNNNLGIYFRTIDLNDIFPNSQFTPQKIIGSNVSLHRRNIGVNWINEKEVIDEIQNLGDKAYTTQPYQYKITLSPSDIKAIKKYNKDKERQGQFGYLDFSLTNDSLHPKSTFLNNWLKDELFKEKYNNLFKINTREGLYDYWRR